MFKNTSNDTVQRAMALAECDAGKPLSEITDADLRKAGWTESRRLAQDLAKAGDWLPCDRVSGVDHFHPDDLVEQWTEFDDEVRAFWKALAADPEKAVQR